MGAVNSKTTGRTLESNVPADVRRMLAAASAKTKSLWESLTPIARRDFISWIESAKQPETRRRRIETLSSRLAAGKRRPCCYALVPMNLYKALGANSKAKAQWKTLTPAERRDVVGWIDSAKDPEARGIRVVQACDMLAAGKRHP